MAKQLTTEDVRQSLRAHVAAKGRDVFERYGPLISWGTLQLILQDKSCVRYPCRVVFDSSILLDGEPAHAVALGKRPEDGYIVHVHPLYMTQLEKVAWLVLYQLVVVNYGDFATSTDAEAFGAAALGISEDEYYAGLCEMADNLKFELGC